MRHLLYLITFITLAFSTYQIGDTISIIDQNLPLSVCYGDYPEDYLKLADFNGELNGGGFSVIAFRMTATW